MGSLLSESSWSLGRGGLVEARGDADDVPLGLAGWQVQETEGRRRSYFPECSFSPPSLPFSFPSLPSFSTSPLPPTIFLLVPPGRHHPPHLPPPSPLPLLLLPPLHSPPPLHPPLPPPRLALRPTLARHAPSSHLPLLQRSHPRRSRKRINLRLARPCKKGRDEVRSHHRVRWS